MNEDGEPDEGQNPEAETDREAASAEQPEHSAKNASTRAQHQEAFAHRQRQLNAGEAIRKLVEQQRLAVGPSATMKAIEDLRKRFDVNTGIHKLVEQQRLAVGPSPTMKAIEDLRKRFQITLEPPAAKLLDGLASGYAKLYEAASGQLDRRWADRHTENPEHPHPVLFIVASLPMALGYPIYEAAKYRKEDSQLLELVEPVLTDPDFLISVEAAIGAAPYLNPIAKEHLQTGVEWLRQQRYVRAYPPLYNGLESALTEVARANGIIDDQNKFLQKGGKASKADDLLAYIVRDSRYRRYLRAWIFGDVGNPFRHGDVRDPEDCRRQSLRLGIALIGWLEIYGQSTAVGFAEAVEHQALMLDSQEDEAA